MIINKKSIEDTKRISNLCISNAFLMLLDEMPFIMQVLSFDRESGTRGKGLFLL